jgi:hypothetical protein
MRGVERGLVAAQALEDDAGAFQRVLRAPRRRGVTWFALNVDAHF